MSETELNGDSWTLCETVPVKKFVVTYWVFAKFAFKI